LLLTDPIDEYLMSHLGEYKGKKFKAADKGDLPAESSEEEKKKAEEFKPLLETIKGKLSEVKEVRLSHRLKESAAVLVADDYAPSAHMERLMKRMGQTMATGEFKRTLEWSRSSFRCRRRMRTIQRSKRTRGFCWIRRRSRRVRRSMIRRGSRKGSMR
jgi:HSP90 family molecular chaperone